MMDGFVLLHISMRKKHRHIFKYLFYIFALGIAIAILTFWFIKVPSIETFSDRQVAESTKIYDRTGEILLWELHGNERRTVVPLHEISRHTKNALLAIEDENFYNHRGISPISMFRGVFLGLLRDGRAQGGSTITQQLVKNTVLDPERSILRKVREAIVALKLERNYTKDEILELYLNEIPFGSNIYGSESAAQTFYGKSVNEITLAESAYLAALPKAPTYFSPYGNHRDELDSRKNLVLRKMLDLGFITENEYNLGKAEEVLFLPPSTQGIRAPHFVMYIRELLNQQFGEQYIERAGLRIVTSLDVELQEHGEEIVARFGEINAEKFNATNAALIALDPKTGEILTMVGSRDYFNVEEEGNFNVVLAHRQPGSAFKPLVYSTAFENGYTPETVVFDLPTEFASGSSESYSPVNYDGKFNGPITLRKALAQSVNVPAVKLLYLTGVQKVLNKAEDFGITTLKDSSRFGLSLVLGGGEVSPLELASAYTTFPNNGIRQPHVAILTIEDHNGNNIFQHHSRPERVLSEYAAHSINSILTDNDSRAPAFGFRSPLYFENASVGAKTGTTNDFRDAWTIGYSTNVVVVAWAGNNDNSSMEKRVAGFIITPLWREYMDKALEKLGGEPLNTSGIESNPKTKPVLRGIWEGSDVFTIDKISGKLATELTPEDLREDRVVKSVHSILHWVNKTNPLGEIPENPEADSQYENWEGPVREWALKNNITDENSNIIPTEFDDIHTVENRPSIQAILDDNLITKRGSVINIPLQISNKFPIEQIDIFINGKFFGTETRSFSSLSIDTGDISDNQLENTILLRLYDNVRNQSQTSLTTTIID